MLNEARWSLGSQYFSSLKKIGAIRYLGFIHGFTETIVSVKGINCN